jgi:hypothetical protein
VLWLDYGGQVERLWAQPMAIAFGHESRLSGHWHVPDLLAQFTWRRLLRVDLAAAFSSDTVLTTAARVLEERAA